MAKSLTTPCFEKASKQRKDYLKTLKRTGTYESFLKIHASRLMARRTLVASLKIPGYNHKLLSDGEFYLFLQNEANLYNTGIFEQMPLIDFEVAYEIACDMGVKYPTDKDGNAIIMTTDQLCQFVNPQKGSEYMEAHSFKYSSDILPGKKSDRKRKRILEKLEIERRYWKRKGIKYKIKTEKNVSRLKSENLNYLRKGAFYTHLFNEQLDDLVQLFIEGYLSKPLAPMREIFEAVSNATGTDLSIVSLAIKYAIWSGRIPYDHSYTFDVLDPIRIPRSN